MITIRTTVLVAALAMLGACDVDDTSEISEAATGSATVRYRYTGKELDATGNYDFGARLYRPASARFLQADSVIPNVYDSQQLIDFNFSQFLGQSLGSFGGWGGGEMICISALLASINSPVYI